MVEKQSAWWHVTLILVCSQFEQTESCSSCSIIQNRCLRSASLTCRLKATTADPKPPLQTQSHHCRPKATTAATTADPKPPLQAQSHHCRPKATTVICSLDMQAQSHHCRPKTTTADPKPPLQAQSHHCDLLTWHADPKLPLQTQSHHCRPKATTVLSEPVAEMTVTELDAFKAWSLWLWFKANLAQIGQLQATLSLSSEVFAV